MAVISSPDISCHQLRHSIEVASKQNIMFFLKFWVQQASCLYSMVTAQAVTAMPETSDHLFRKLGLDVNFRTCMSQNCIMFIPVSWLRRSSATKIQELNIFMSIIVWWTRARRLLKSPFFKFSCNYHCTSHTTDSSETLYMKGLHGGGGTNLHLTIPLKGSVLFLSPLTVSNSLEAVAVLTKSFLQQGGYTSLK